MPRMFPSKALTTFKIKSNWVFYFLSCEQVYFGVCTCLYIDLSKPDI